MSKGPWFITEADALKRDAKVAREFAADVRRVLTPGMSDAAIRRRLAEEGYGASLLRKLWPFLERVHG